MFASEVVAARERAHDRGLAFPKARLKRMGAK